MSGNKSRTKGKVGEREIRHILDKKKYTYEWTPLEDKPDLLILAQKDNIGAYHRIDEHWEIKYQAKIPLILYQWLDEKGAKALLIRRVNAKDHRKYPWLKIEVFK